MKYRALACDYDGTLAHDGVVNTTTVDALDRFRASGRNLIMVTGTRITGSENRLSRP
jgi:hydroxymethylpyrimidine pyrophosphatase-like HAD family hydrolase